MSAATPPTPRTPPAPEIAARAGAVPRSTSALPPWAQEMCDLFRSGAVAQFIIHGNIFDIVGASSGPTRRPLSLKEFLNEVIFASYDVVLHYDRSRGVHLTRGADDFAEWMEQTFGREDARKFGLMRESGIRLLANGCRPAPVSRFPVAGS